MYPARSLCKYGQFRLHEMGGYFTQHFVLRVTHSKQSGENIIFPFTRVAGVHNPPVEFSRAVLVFYTLGVYAGGHLSP